MRQAEATAFSTSIPLQPDEARAGRSRRPSKSVAVGDHAALQDLVGAAAQLAQGQGLEQRGVGDHRLGLVEGADEVLGPGVVDADLAAHRAVHHGQERGGHLHPHHPAHVGGGREARHVAHHPAPEGHHQAVAADARAPASPSWTAARVAQGLVALPVGDQDAAHRAQPLQRRPRPAAPCSSQIRRLETSAMRAALRAAGAGRGATRARPWPMVTG